MRIGVAKEIKQSEYRVALTPAGALELGRNGHEVILKDLGHSDDFWTYEPKASTRLVTTFLDTGRVDTSLYTKNTVDFTPTVGQGNVAKIVLAVMLGWSYIVYRILRRNRWL